jgi:hypothetical protein
MEAEAQQAEYYKAKDYPVRERADFAMRFGVKTPPTVCTYDFPRLSLACQFVFCILD